VLEKWLYSMSPSYRLICLVGLLSLLHGDIAFCDDLREIQWIGLGPIPVVNQSPIQLLFLQPIPDRAEVLPGGRKALGLNTAVTNTLVSKSSGNYSGIVDMEMVRTELDFRAGIHPRLELGISLAVAYSYGGVMDRSIRDVEDFFGDPRKARIEEDPGGYEYQVKKGGETFIGGRKRSSGIGNLAFRIKGKIGEESTYSPCLSARLALKLPIGHDDRALGTGKPDLGIGVLLQKEIKGLNVYLNADLIFPGDAFDQVGVSVHQFYSFVVGGEYTLTPQFSVVPQFRYTSRPFRNTGLDMLDRRIYDFMLGVNYRTNRGIFIQVGGVEDFHDSCDAGADITFYLNIGRYF